MKGAGVLAQKDFHRNVFCPLRGVDLPKIRGGRPLA